MNRAGKVSSFRWERPTEATRIGAAMAAAVAYEGVWFVGVYVCAYFIGGLKVSIGGCMIFLEHIDIMTYGRVPCGKNGKDSISRRW